MRRVGPARPGAGSIPALFRIRWPSRRPAMTVLFDSALLAKTVISGNTGINSGYRPLPIVHFGVAPVLLGYPYDAGNVLEWK
jgi:hypothetical protein